MQSGPQEGRSYPLRTVSEPGNFIHPSLLDSPGLVAWPSRATGTGKKAGSV